ncbi:MAG: hypothetical protein HQ575_05400, partial [Candidatus Omnitrophica bacterium]|nr:hypothetical protein [Candidatus Omnitrophota bacterium]
ILLLLRESSEDPARFDVSEHLDEALDMYKAEEAREAARAKEEREKALRAIHDILDALVKQTAANLWDLLTFNALRLEVEEEERQAKAKEEEEARQAKAKEDVAKVLIEDLTFGDALKGWMAGVRAETKKGRKKGEAEDGQKLKAFLRAAEEMVRRLDREALKRKIEAIFEREDVRRRFEEFGTDVSVVRQVFEASCDILDLLKRTGGKPKMKDIESAWGVTKVEFLAPYITWFLKTELDIDFVRFEPRVAIIPNFGRRQSDVQEAVPILRRLFQDARDNGREPVVFVTWDPNIQRWVNNMREYPEEYLDQVKPKYRRGMKAFLGGRPMISILRKEVTANPGVTLIDILKMGDKYEGVWHGNANAYETIRALYDLNLNNVRGGIHAIKDGTRVHSRDFSDFQQALALFLGDEEIEALFNPSDYDTWLLSQDAYRSYFTYLELYLDGKIEEATFWRNRAFRLYVECLKREHDRDVELLRRRLSERKSADFILIVSPYRLGPLPDTEGISDYAFVEENPLPAECRSPENVMMMEMLQKRLGDPGSEVSVSEEEESLKKSFIYYVILRMGFNINRREEAALIMRIMNSLSQEDVAALEQRVWQAVELLDTDSYDKKMECAERCVYFWLKEKEKIPKEDQDNFVPIEEAFTEYYVKELGALAKKITSSTPSDRGPLAAQVERLRN